MLGQVLTDDGSKDEEDVGNENAQEKERVWKKGGFRGQRWGVVRVK